MLQDNQHQGQTERHLGLAVSLKNDETLSIVMYLHIKLISLNIFILRYY